MLDSASTEKYRAYFSGLSTEELFVKYKNEDGKWSKECVDLCCEELVKRGEIAAPRVETNITRELETVKTTINENSEKIGEKADKQTNIEDTKPKDNNADKKALMEESNHIQKNTVANKKVNITMQNKKCIFCGNEILKGDRFCSTCGRNLLDTKKCQKCGEINEGKDNFCSGCGSKF